MLRLGLVICLLLLSACVPKAKPQDDYFSRNSIGPERQISFEGRVAKLGFIGEDANSLIARGAVAAGSFEAPASTLYQFSGSDNQFYVCQATGQVFEIRLIFTDGGNNGYLTPFGVGFLSFLDELQSAGLRVAGENGQLLYFSYGYDDGNQLTQSVGFYFTYDQSLNRITVIDIIAPC